MESKSFVVSADVVQPIIQVVSDNIAVLLPAGLGITAMLVGAGLVPKMFKKFTRG